MLRIEVVQKKDKTNIPLFYLDSKQAIDFPFHPFATFNCTIIYHTPVIANSYFYVCILPLLVAAVEEQLPSPSIEVHPNNRRIKLPTADEEGEEAEEDEEEGEEDVLDRETVKKLAAIAVARETKKLKKRKKGRGDKGDSP